MGSNYTPSEALSYDFIRIIPYLVVLIGALVGLNVFLLLVGGTVLSLGIGLAYGDFGLLDIFNIMGDGITSMYDITVISILVAGSSPWCVRMAESTGFCTSSANVSMESGALRWESPLYPLL